MGDHPYRQVADRLRRYVTVSGFRPGDRLPRLRDLVVITGSTMPVVRRAIDLLRHDGVVISGQGPGMRLGRLPAITRGGTSRVVMLSTDIELHRDFIADQIDELIRQGAAGQIEVLVKEIPHDADGAVALLAVGSLAPAAVILGGIAREPAVRQLEAAGYPVIISGEVIVGTAATGGFRQVRGGDQESAYLLAQHLVALGHRRIGIIGIQGQRPYQVNRLRGVTDGLVDAGCWDPGLVALARFDDQAEQRTAVARNLLDRRDPPTAVAIIDTWLATPVFAASAALDRSVPGDLSVAGFEVERDPAGMMTHFELSVSTWVGHLLTLVEEAITHQPPRTILVERQLMLRGTTRSLHTGRILGERSPAPVAPVR